MRLLGPEPVVEALPALAGAGRRCRRELEVGERSAEIEAGAADDDRRAPLGECAVDGLVRETLVLGDGAFVVERPDADERGRSGGLVREDRQALVDLHRVGRDDLRRDGVCDRLGDGRLPARRGAKDANDHPRQVSGGHNTGAAAGLPPLPA